MSMAKTNADCIRAMSDEELRNWLFQRDCKNIAAFLQHGGAGVMNAAQLFDWLRQPVEENDHAEELKSCPFSGDETNDCADCAYSGDFHFVKGECQRRDNNPELLKDGDKE